MQEKIREVLSGVIDPNTGKDLVSSKALKKVTTEDGKTTVQIELDYPAKTQGPVIEEMVRAKLVEAGIPADVKISPFAYPRCKALTRICPGKLRRYFR